MSTTAMTVQDVAAYLNVDPKTVCRRVKRGDLPGLEVGSSWRSGKEDIHQRSAQQREAAARGDEEDR